MAEIWLVIIRTWLISFSETRGPLAFPGASPFGSRAPIGPSQWILGFSWDTLQKFLVSLRITREPEIPWFPTIGLCFLQWPLTRTIVFPSILLQISTQIPKSFLQCVWMWALIYYYFLLQGTAGHTKPRWVYKDYGRRVGASARGGEQPSHKKHYQKLCGQGFFEKKLRNPKKRKKGQTTTGTKTGL